jgi:hypothetical protein
MSLRGFGQVFLSFGARNRLTEGHVKVLSYKVIALQHRFPCKALNNALAAKTMFN